VPEADTMKSPGVGHRGPKPSGISRELRHALLLGLVLASSWLVLLGIDPESVVPPAWPASGLAAGLYLTSPRRYRPTVLAATFVLVLTAHLLHGVAVPTAVAVGTISAVEVWLVRRLLLHGLGGRDVGLLERGDVPRLVLVTCTAALASAGGYAAIAGATGDGTPWLTGLAVFGTHAASLLVLLPLFLASPWFPAIADVRERVAQWVLTLGTAVAVFTSADTPPILFAVMPMFAWLAFRGTLREAAYLLVAVATIGTVLTTFEIGPVWELGVRYDLAPELVIGFLQLFVLDCALILLPLAVSAARQRLLAGQAASRRATLERLVASATGTAIYATDREGRIILFNPGAEAMLGYNLYEVLGEFPDRFHPVTELARRAEEAGTGRSFAEISAGVVASGQPRRLWEFVRANGEHRTMLMTIATVLDDNGDFNGYLATAEDVTEREEAQAALEAAVETQRQALERLQALDRAKTDFVSTVSHELRTPLTNITGYTELLEEGAVGELSAEQRDLIGRVDRNGRRLLLLIEDLLTYSRLESTGVRIDPEPSDLREAVGGAFEAITSTLTKRDLSVGVDLPREPVMVRGEAVLLERMVTNLLTNAVKFTPDGGTIEALLSVGDGVTRLIVRDDGVGIPAREQDQLFTRFFRSSTATKSAVQGTGLGLSIVQGIVSQHGGEVGIHSVEGHGTTVTVTLPLVATIRLAPPAMPDAATG
jgi:PAS domain S-box-containing protein